MKKRILSLFLAITCLLTILPLQVLPSYAYTNVTTTRPFTFVKTGRVITLVKDYDNYYIMRETFAADGSYVENVVLQTITKTQYESELAKKQYDVHKVSEITSSIDNQLINSAGGRLYFVNIVEGVSGASSYSFIGSLGNGYNNSFSMSDLSQQFGTPHSYLLNNNGRYFRCTNNSITGITTMVPIEQDTFDLLKLTMDLEDLSYLREIKYSNDGLGKAHYSDTVYGVTGLVLVSFVKDAVEIDASIQDIRNGKSFNDTSVADENEAADSFDPERYGDNYSEWSDNFNKGYMGQWSDPSFLGEMELVEWVDPFWTNSDISNSGTKEKNGYFDDVGNWIDTDIYGNPIPSIPGTFDSAGNFMPDGLEGYYDPNGVYHPLFEENEISLDGNNIVIGDEGYFDRYGTWHEENKAHNVIYLYDGSWITAEGLYYNKSGELVDVLPCDIWGNFEFGSWLVYPDGSIFDKFLNQLILNNGEVYVAEITDRGNFFFENGIMIMKDSFAKGIKTGDGTILLDNNSIIYENNIIEYSNGIIFNNNIIVLPSEERMNGSFKNGEIDLNQYGKIYSNGHYAEYNDFKNLVSDDDRIFFNDGDTMFANGNIRKSNGYIEATYMDRNLNIVSISGDVYNRKLEKGAYNQKGEFVKDLTPDTAYFDALGNQVGDDGTIICNEDLGYYDASGTFNKGSTVFENGYYTSDGHWIGLDGQIVKKENLFGYVDENNDFVMYDKSGKYDSHGVFYQNYNDEGFYINENGNLVIPQKSDFVINMDGSISLLGEKSTYVGNGLFKINKNTGYYDELGRFIIAKVNPYIIELNGFYDSEQNFHKESEIYIDNNGNWKLLYNPNLGLKIEDGYISFAYSSQKYDVNGITEVDGKIGYYNKNGTFIESKQNPFLGGFYNNVGTWIDKTYYLDVNNELCINNGVFIYTGNYITPSGDIGYFNNEGIFILNKLNPYDNGFYDSTGTFHNESFLYLDSLGMYKGFGDKFIIDKFGRKIETANKSVSISGYDLIYFGIFADDEGNLGIFDASGTFIKNKNSYDGGLYLPNGKYIKLKDGMTTYNNLKFYGLNYIVVNTESDKYLLYFYDGYSIELTSYQDYYITSEGYLLSKNFEFVADGKTKDAFWINDKFFVDNNDSSGFFNENGTFFKYNGAYGYYTSSGEFKPNLSNPYINGFYNSLGEWNGEDYTPNKGYFNKYGIPRNGISLSLNGYYDHEGTWHEFNQDFFIDINGNAHVKEEYAIGYRDINDNIHIYNEDGYFNSEGTYIVDNTIMGYYNKDGELKMGKNSSLEGFYDMNRNWHQFNGTGYFDADGKYYENINGEIIGYFNSVGEFTEGYNPYLNGFYGFNGVWVGDNDPITVYFDILGVKHIGSAPYFNGFYDMFGNWYFTKEKGYYDRNGTFYNLTTGEIGYYDKLGIYYEGTNPYQHGFYDANKNLHLFGQEGYYDSKGVYVDVYGNNYYYLSGGIRREGINPNVDGFFDVRSNWHEFGGNGYYDSTGEYHDYLLVISSFKVGSPDYILFEGIFENNDFVSSKVQNTVQFSLLSDGVNTRYLDTGIKVAANAMISYDKAVAILHAISIYNQGVFIEDNDSCILIHEGSIINLKNNGKISIKELKDKFVDADIEIVVARSRIGRRYALADAIEANKNIQVYNDGKKMQMNYPFVVKNGVPYVAINDFKDTMVYDVKVAQTSDGTFLSFDLKENLIGINNQIKREGENDEAYFFDSVTTVVGKSLITCSIDGNIFNITDGYQFINVRLDGMSTNVVYMPAAYLDTFTNKNVVLDTHTYELILSSKDDVETPVVDF